MYIIPGYQMFETNKYIYVILTVSCYCNKKHLYYVWTNIVSCNCKKKSNVEVWSGDIIGFGRV